MKKIFTLLITLSVIVGAYANSNGFRISSDSTWKSITLTSYIISSDLPSPSSWRIIGKKTGDSVYLQGDTLITTSVGTKVTTLQHVAPATTYRIKLIGWKNAVADTIDMGYVTTASLPSAPTVTYDVFPKIGVSTITVHVAGAHGYRYKVKAIYGTSYVSSNSIIGTENFTDTLYLSTPLPSTAYSYIILGYYLDSVPGLADGPIKTGTLTTPAVDTGYIIGTTIGVTAYRDSVRASVSIHAGMYPGTLIWSLYDSTGSLIFGRIVSGIINSGSYSQLFSGLMPGTLYYLNVQYSDQLNTDSLSGYIRTLPRPTIPAANVSLSGSIMSNCGRITIGTIAITGTTSGHLTLFKIARGTDGATFPDTVLVIPGISRDTTLYNLDVPADLANTRTYYKGIVFSEDNISNVSNVVNAKTPPGDVPSLSLEVKDSIVPVVITTGDGWCDRTTILITLYNSAHNSVFTTAIDAGTALYRKRILTTQLPAGNYTFHVCARNQYGEVCNDESFSHFLATGIIELKDTHSFDPTTIVFVSNMLGVQVGQEQLGNIDQWISTYPSGMFILNFVDKMGQPYVIKRVVVR